MAPVEIHPMTDEALELTREFSQDELAAEFVAMRNDNGRLRRSLEKVIVWLEKLAAQSSQQERSNRGRFDSLADACAADAKNYRATAADLRKTLSVGQ